MRSTKVVDTMRERVLAITETPEHAAVREAYFEVRPWGHADEKKARKENPNGLHRLRDRVPELARDQEVLARYLAEVALLNRRPAFERRASHPDKSVIAMFEQALKDDATAKEIAKRARKGNRTAWGACVMFYDETARISFTGERPTITKYLAPIPEPIDGLLRDCLAGYVSPPPPKTGSSHFYGATPEECDAIRFAMWCGTESALKMTSRNGPCTVGTLSAITEVPKTKLARIWQERSLRPSRGTRW